MLQIVGLILVGGLLLLWVAWKMYRELHHGGESAGSPEIAGDEHSGIRPAKSFAAAAWAVAIADVSMSLDNVLAVAGAARDHPGIMIVGLIFAVALMGLAANVIAKYIERYRWIAYVGLRRHPLRRGQDDLGRLDRPAGRRGPPVRLMGDTPLDTIVALSSGRLPAAIAVIRTSGPAALAAAAAVAGTAARTAPRQPAHACAIPPTAR